MNVGALKPEGIEARRSFQRHLKQILQIPADTMSPELFAYYNYVAEDGLPFQYLVCLFYRNDVLANCLNSVNISYLPEFNQGS